MEIKTQNEYINELEEINVKIRKLTKKGDKITLDECYTLYDYIIRYNEIKVLLKEYEK